MSEVETWAASMADPNNTYGGSQSAELSISEEAKYRKKCRDLKRRINEIELHNESLVIKLARTKRYIQRVRLERAFLLEKLEENTPRRAPGSDGTPSPPASPSMEAYSMDALEQLSPGNNRDLDSPVGGRGDPFDALHLQATPRDSPAPVAPPKKVKPPRDPLAPRRPRNPFLLFCEEERESVRAAVETPNGEPVDIARELGKVWADMNEEHRQPYRDIYEEDKLRYAREMAAYELTKKNTEAANAKMDDGEKSGNAVLENGDRSSPAPMPSVPVKTGGFTAVNRG